MKETKYDLEERLLEFSVRIIPVTESVRIFFASLRTAESKRFAKKQA